MRFIIGRFLLWAFVFCTIVSLSSCIINQPRYCKEFNNLSLDERKEAVKENSVETNFALIRCAYYTEGGPEIADVPIIEGGQASVPFLLSKLESNDEHEQERAISLLQDIDIQERLQNRTEIITKIEKAVDKMKNEQNRQYSLEMLNKMKGQRVL